MNLLATAVIQPRISWFHFPFPVDFGSELRGIFLLLEFRFTLRLLGKDKAAATGFFGCPVDLWGHQKILFIVLGLTAEWQRLCAICSLMCQRYLIINIAYCLLFLLKTIPKPDILGVIFFIFLTFVIEINTISIDSYHL